MKFAYTILVVIILVSCNKILDVGQPRTQLSGTAIFSSDATATGALLSIYSQMEVQGMLYRIILNTGLSADEFKLRSTDPAFMAVATNNLSANNAVTSTHWTLYYSLIYQVNAVLEGLQRSTALTEPVSRQLRGECLVLRALFYFYLVNLYGDVPLALTTDYAVNARLARQLMSEIYDQVLQDLTEAETLLDTPYKNAQNTNTTERVRPNKAVAQALLARCYLYKDDWMHAKEKADLVIGNTSYSLLSNLDQVFLKNSNEQIWQLMAVLPNFNSFAGNQLILTGEPALVHLDTAFIKQFRAGDKRRTSWVGSINAGGTTWYFPFKQKIKTSATITEYTSVLRLSEQFLIRAEARAQLGDLTGGCTDLSVVRLRAGIPAVTGLSREQLLDSIQKERRFELFTEAGDRWLNLKRTGQATTILGPLKGSNWSDNDQLYPIPFNERLLNPALTQNPGY